MSDLKWSIVLWIKNNPIVKFWWLNKKKMNLHMFWKYESFSYLKSDQSSLGPTSPTTPQSRIRIRQHFHGGLLRELPCNDLIALKELTDRRSRPPWIVKTLGMKEILEKRQKTSKKKVSTLKFLLALISQMKLQPGLAFFGKNIQKALTYSFA